MYKLILNEEGQINDTLVFHTEKKCYIPFDNANTDYQEYLQWLDDGNTPEPADEVTE